MTTTASIATKTAMSNSITEPVIPDQRSYASVLSDLDYRPLGEHIRRPSLATRSIRVGASFTSLDLWYVDLDVTADALYCFRQGLSFRRNGKPVIESGRGHVEFNLAHSGGDAVIALAGDAVIGVESSSGR